MFHQRGVLYTDPYVQVASELVAFKEAGIKFYAVDGNHDHEDRLGEVHALQPLIAGGLMEGCLDGWVNIWVSITCVSLFSYCDNTETFHKRLKESREDYLANTNPDDLEPRIGLFHHGFKGARVGTALEYVVKEEIDAEDLRGQFDFVLSGHYHTHQPIVGLDNGWYIGSPLQHTRNDYEEEMYSEKGFIVLDTDDWSWHVEPLKRPMFVRFDAQHVLGPALDEREVRGNFVDVLYTTQDELKAALQELKSFEPRGVYPIPDAVEEQEDKRRLDVNPVVDPRKVLKRYVKHQNPQLNHKRLISRGVAILQKAQEKKGRL